MAPLSFTYERVELKLSCTEKLNLTIEHLVTHKVSFSHKVRFSHTHLTYIPQNVNFYPMKKGNVTAQTVIWLDWYNI